MTAGVGRDLVSSLVDDELPAVASVRPSPSEQKGGRFLLPKEEAEQRRVPRFIQEARDLPPVVIKADDRRFRFWLICRFWGGDAFGLKRGSPKGTFRRSRDDYISKATLRSKSKHEITALELLRDTGRMLYKRLFHYFDDYFVYHVTGRVPAIDEKLQPTNVLRYTGECSKGARLILQRIDGTTSAKMHERKECALEWGPAHGNQDDTQSVRLADDI
ncbi:hypothetical protein HDU85_001250 [Gaertneriomyces sp. JEL0708]|nr:hypothetical protein HDU85_001250 [Gaertneriomyces sp. JEL0708]